MWLKSWKPKTNHQKLPNFVPKDVPIEHPNKTLRRPHTATPLQIHWTQWYPHTLTTRLTTYLPNTWRHLCTHRHNTTNISIWIRQLLLFYWFCNNIPLSPQRTPRSQIKTLQYYSIKNLATAKRKLHKSTSANITHPHGVRWRGRNSTRPPRRQSS